jgi:hypothetical protein
VAPGGPSRSAMRTSSATDFASILRMTCHMTSGPDNTNHALALAFGVLVVFMVVAGSLWIMADLNGAMHDRGRVRHRGRRASAARLLRWQLPWIVGPLTRQSP